MSPLITTVELADRLGSSDLQIVDGSWFLDGRDAKAAFEQAHISTSVFFDLEANSDPASPLPHMLPTAERFAAAAGTLGIGENDEIVVLDQVGLFSAARVWWTFRQMGAKRVRVLDGGLPRWLAEGRPVVSGPWEARAARFRAGAPAGVSGLAEVQAALGGGGQLVDARPAARFLGTAPEPRPGLRRGHMPGALNLPFTALIGDGALRPALDLMAAFSAAGVDLDRPAIATCGSGVTAAILVLAAAVLGRDMRLYDASWAEWGAREDLPVVVG